MFRLTAKHIHALEHKLRVPFTGSHSYLVTLSSGGVVTVSVPCVVYDHTPTETDDEFLESLPEAN